MKEYRQLHRQVQHRMQTHHLQALIPSLRPSMKRSMTRSSCPCWKCPEAPLPLQIKATNWPPADEIDPCNNDLVVTITEVIAGNTISTENHLISSVDLFEANPKQLDIKLRGKKDGSPPLLFSGKCTGEEEGKGPSMEVVAAAVGFRRRRQALEVAAAAVFRFLRKQITDQ